MRGASSLRLGGGDGVVVTSPNCDIDRDFDTISFSCATVDLLLQTGLHSTPVKDIGSPPVVLSTFTDSLRDTARFS